MPRIDPSGHANGRYPDAATRNHADRLWPFSANPALSPADTDRIPAAAQRAAGRAAPVHQARRLHRAGDGGQQDAQAGIPGRRGDAAEGRHAGHPGCRAVEPCPPDRGSGLQGGHEMPCAAGAPGAGSRRLLRGDGQRAVGQPLWRHLRFPALRPRHECRGRGGGANAARAGPSSLFHTRWRLQRDRRAGLRGLRAGDCRSHARDRPALRLGW